MGDTNSNDSLYAAVINSSLDAPELIPKSLIDPMPCANEDITRLERLVRDFMPPHPVLTCTTLDWWVDRAVAHLCTRDVHAASTTIN